MLFIIEFFRLREGDDAHATLDRITQSGNRSGGGESESQIALRDIEHAAEALRLADFFGPGWG